MTDTIRLLRECDAGVKMGVNAINEVLPYTKREALKKILADCRDKHEALLSDVQKLLEEQNDAGKEPSAMASGMSWMKTNLTLMHTQEDVDEKVADLITDGCNMGVKSLRKYLNQYGNADTKAKDRAKRLINLEEALVTDVKDFL